MATSLPKQTGKSFWRLTAKRFVGSESFYLLPAVHNGSGRSTSSGIASAVWSLFSPGTLLVTDGIYSVIRHPSYLGLLVNSLGWGLAFRSGVGVLLTMALIPPLLARIRAEEALLGEQFGEEYRAYCARTSRLIPGLY